MTECVLITGASSGIGRQCAIELSHDYRLVLCARNEQELEKTRLLCSSSEQHFLLPLDLSCVERIEEKMNAFLQQHSLSIHKFLHCAGIVNLLPAKGFDYSVCGQIFNVNLFSAMAIVKMLLKKNNKKALNNIVFISALYSKKGVIGNSFYASSKGALDSYMRSIAKELAPAVRVNSVLPGGINTNMLANLDTDNLAELEKHYPLGFGEAQDIAAMVSFLFSEKSKWITGQQISVDGGASI